MNTNLAAFLAVIRACEGTAGPNGYRTLFGGGLFNSYDEHPRVAVTASGYTSTAAGAYQILSRSWDDYRAKTGAGKSFSPEAQDAYAVWAIRDKRKALDDVLAGRFQVAITRCANEWASLPGSIYGQPTRTMDYCLAVYAKAGGLLRPVPDTIGVSKPQTIGESPVAYKAPAESTRKVMDPKPASIFGSAIANLIPQVAKIFLAGTPYGALADTVVQTVVQATGAVNEQQAVQLISDDPAMLQKATDAVLTQPDVAALLEVGGGIPEARKFDLAATNAERPFWYSQAFWVTMLVVVPPVDFMVALVIWRMPAPSEQLATQVITGLLGILAVAAAFYFGSSMGSQKKDEALARVGK